MTPPSFVKHKVFGVGRVVDRSDYLYVDFIQYIGRKKFPLGFAALESIEYDAETFEVQYRLHRAEDEYPVHDNENDLMTRGLRKGGCFEMGRRR